MKKPILLPFLLIAWIFGINAQNDLEQTGNRITIQGSVLDINGTPVENAIVFVDGKETEAKTDADGVYSIKVKKSAEKIGIVAFGTGILEQEIDGRSRIDFFFNHELADLPDFETENEIEPGEEIVNTGYSLIKRKYIAGDVGFLDVEHSKKKYTTVMQILMETPGIVMQNGGIYVSGPASNFVQGRIPPLIMLNSSPCYSLNIPTSEIISVTVLKGASAAIYGSMGMGGVIIITTKIP